MTGRRASGQAGSEPVRWLFGDQLGPHFLDSDDQRVLLIESRKVFARRRFHRQKAHLVLSAMRHRAAELGDRCEYRTAATYSEVLRDRPAGAELTVCHPTSYAARDLVERTPGVRLLPARGFATSMAEFADWANARGARRLLMEDHYRLARRRLDVLMDGDEPVGGQWNYDQENRLPPPKATRGGPPVTGVGVPAPWWPEEDEIDDEVRRDLDRWAADGDVGFIGVDGPRRFPATRSEALAAFQHFVDHRLTAFGPYEDAMLAGDPWLAHSLMSSSLNLGLLDPLELVRRVETACRHDDLPISSVEGFVRQLIGWRDYIWNLYWHLGPGYRFRNGLHADRDIPAWFAELDADAVEANCLSSILGDLRDHGWVHHIPRLMVLGNHAMQRGWNPLQVTDWFHRAFVDGYDWVMVPNVVGMSQHADGGLITTKPYAGGGAYIDRMSDYCGGCRYRPSVRVGDDACPFTAGYWWFLNRHRGTFAGNHRMAQPLRGLDRLKDLLALVEQEDARGSAAP
jgi:deoxyribodipyrimidine photolyase-related protein